MEPDFFFSIITAVIAANSACIAGVYGFVRVNRENDFDWYSAGALIYAAGIAALAAYLAT